MTVELLPLEAGAVDRDRVESLTGHGLWPHSSARLLSAHH